MIETIIKKTIDLLEDVDFYGTIFDIGGEDEAASWIREELEKNPIGFYQDTAAFIEENTYDDPDMAEDHERWRLQLKDIHDLIMALHAFYY